MDKIILSGMKFFGRHGVLPQERELGQKFEVDLELCLDLAPAGKNDELDSTVSYAEVFAVVERVVTGPPMKLIEAVAERVAGGVLESFPIESVRVRIKKPGAPVPGCFDYMAVEIERRK
ncbi:dihydroneopterin aldolase [Desulfocucumis palustris]|uniref:7,8-dihydroneopterin aldolase n=1 Tax=Desulfocucumis palustris TaxID=1898651 RepID=A0A2L2XE67_9FIRM|nr:dihydroneopterin aldolase [Desulfocucumis palustris]GBF32121.1 dihydroneopterin aldolase [Desulfocucumis palustris]